MMLDGNEQRTHAKSLYDRLESDRKPYTDRAETNAKYTIPSLFPKSSDTSSTKYENNNQSMGARGVNNLVSKLLLALLPANTTFFRLNITDSAEAELQAQGGDEVKQRVESALMQLEQRILKYIESQQIRTTVLEALKQLIVAGNALLFLPPVEGGAKAYKLSSYVCQRDGLGNVLQIVTLDNLAYASCPDSVKAILAKNGDNHKPEEKVAIYTHIYLDGDVFKSYQEVNEIIISGSEGEYPKTKCPWIAMRLNKVDGESYGRSYVEEYIGDLKALDGHSEALLNASIISAHILYLVNPTGVTQPRRLQKAKTGDFVPGKADDVECLQLNKSVDLQVTSSMVDKLEQRLSYAFLLNSAVQRNAERVTAEEIRYVAGELEDTLGGTYAILSQEFQLPLVRRIMAQLEALGEIPELPEGTVDPAITTGLEAIGRGHDLSKLSQFLTLAGNVAGAEQYLNISGVLLAGATGVGLDPTGILKSPEQVQQEQQQAQMMQMAQQATPQLARGFADAQKEQQAPQQ